MRTDAGDRFIQQNTDFAAGLSAAEREVVDFHAEHHSGGLIVLFRDLDEDGWYVKAHDTWGPTGPDEEGPCIVHIYRADDTDDEREQVLSFPDGSSAIEAFLTAEAPAPHVQVEEILSDPTPTVRELVEVLLRLDQDLPIVGYMPAPVDTYVNIDGVRFDSRNPDVAVTIELRHDFDTRQF